MPLPKTIIHLLSGGMDSTVLLYELHKQGHELHTVAFNYGQTHIKELQLARWHSINLGVQHSQIELTRRDGPFLRCALTDGSSDSVVVPNRNAIFLMIAAGIAASNGAQTVTIGCNKDDEKAFPDCTWRFIQAAQATLKAGGSDVELCAPYIGWTKGQIARLGEGLNVDFSKTWSCYRGGIAECGECDACEKRKGALCE